MNYIHIYRTVGGLKINNQLYIGYTKREALKRYRAENGLTRKNALSTMRQKAVKYIIGDIANA